MVTMKIDYARILGGLLVVLMSLGALPAQAQGWYGGVSAGSFKDDIFDESDTGWKVYAGHRLSREAAFEFGYVDLGEVTLTGPGGSATVESSGFNGVFVGHLPFSDQFSFFGKIGLFMWESDLSGNVPALGGDIAASDDGVDLTYGIGLQWKIGRNIDLRAEFEHFEDDIGDLLSAGITFGF